MPIDDDYTFCFIQSKKSLNVSAKKYVLQSSSDCSKEYA